jgi:hypothetical protein
MAQASSVSTSVDIKLSEPIDAASVTTSTITLRESGTSSPVPATVSYLSAGNAATLKPIVPLKASTAYTATVRGGATGVKDVSGNALASDVTWSFTTAATATSAARYLSDLAWTQATNGWGPVERDRSNGDVAAGDGVALSIQGKRYAKGLGVHPLSDVRFNLAGSCTTYAAQIGIDDEVNGRGSVVFQVWADGVRVFDSGLIMGNSAARPISVDVRGRNELRLVVTDGGDGNNFDHANWADALVTCEAVDNTPPTITSASPGDRSTVPVDQAIVQVTFSEPMAGTTLTNSTVRMVKVATGVAVLAAVTYQVATNTAVLTPNAGSIEPGTQYSVTVQGGSGGVRDAAGNALATTSEWSITTALAAATVAEENVVFPLDAGVINVRNYGARGDGVTDDTMAIRAAIEQNIASRKAIVYLPAGVYVVSDTLFWRDTGGTWRAYLTLQGQGRSSTIIKLRNSAPGFTDVTRPRAVLFTASERVPAADGSGNEGFRNNILNLTVDTGSGNPGAIAIDYLGHNQATVRDVTIRSADGLGSIGLNLTRRWVGPCLIKDVTIEGFNYGMRVKEGIASVTMENITLQNQRIAGIDNDGNVVSILNLTSINQVPAVRNVGWPALLTLINASLTAGSSTNFAIENTGDAKSYLRGISSAGYRAVMNNNGTVVSGSSIGEHVSHAVRSLFTSPQRSLNLQIAPTPKYADSNVGDWANVRHYGAIADDYVDDTAAIQAALDSGKTTIYLPPGAYRLTNTLRIRGAVRRVFAPGVDFVPHVAFPLGRPAVRFEAVTGEFVVFERVTFSANYGFPEAQQNFPHPIIQHASPKTVVIRDVQGYTYSNVAGSGPVFLENVCCGEVDINSQTAWVRQFNTETTRNPKVRNNGGQLWSLGLKTEFSSTVVIETIGGGSTEVLGGFLSIWTDQPVNAFVNRESRHSLVIATGIDWDYTVPISETRDGVTRVQPRIFTRYRGSTFPLFVGYK